MQTQAHFDNIQSHILQELKKSQRSITIAVAWFTDVSLFEILCKKSKQGIQIQLMIMNDDINNSCGINYDLLVKAGGKVWKVGSENLMHNKFCVIDNQTVINGSYNWTNKARQNHESITIIEDKELALQFVEEFLFLRRKYFGDSPETLVMDYAQICIRLETLKNVILLDDKEDIDYQLQKIKKLLVSPADDSASTIGDIIKNTEKRNYSAAVSGINDFVGKFRTLTVYVDSEIAAMRLEIKALGLQISSLEDEKNEIEKLLFAFTNRYALELGELMRKILFIKKEKLKEEAKHEKAKEQEAKEAEADYEDFNQSYEKNKGEHINELTEEQQADLKKKYRKATKLCHPDVVNELQKEQAKVVFQNLKNAYDKNDIQTVTQILSELEKGIFSDKTSEINKKQELIAIIHQLRIKRDELEQELTELKKSAVYTTICEISDWDKYFSEKKARLQEELDILE
jgi:hypothetical protein